MKVEITKASTPDSVTIQPKLINKHQAADTQDYPQHLSKVNFLSMDAFSTNIEDTSSHKAYHDAILDNRYLFEGKTVLHLTEGMNCLFSFFAVEAGCKKVYCVLNGKSEKEQQNIYMIKEVIKENNKEQIIEALSWSDFNAQVDIIIGQPMGYCMHFDGMLDRIIQARDLYLSKKGLIFPNNISFKCAVVHDQYFYDHKVEFWNSVYGIPMKSMKRWISHEPIIRVMDPALIVSKVVKVLSFDLHKVSYEQIVKIDRVFELKLLGPCKGNGLVFWFEANFDHGIEKKDIKASPWVESTKYTQVTLYWPTVQQYKGGNIRVRVKGEKYPKEGYSIISTEVDYKKHQYSFS